MVKKKHSTQIVYDSHEYWKNIYRYGFLKKLESLIDTFFERKYINSGRISRIFVVSKSIEQVYSHYSKKSKTPVAVVPNTFSKIRFVDRFVKYNNKKLAPSSIYRPLGLVYGGVIEPKRDLETPIIAAKMFKFIRLILVGRQDETFLKSMKIAGCENIVVMPPIELNKLAKLIATYGASLISLDCRNKNSLYALPNKLFLNIACRTPFISVYNSEIANIVIPNKIGILYKSGDVNSFVNAYEEFFSSYQELRQNFRTVPERYFWEGESEKVLLKCYYDLRN